MLDSTIVFSGLEYKLNIRFNDKLSTASNEETFPHIRFRISHGNMCNKIKLQSHTSVLPVAKMLIIMCICAMSNDSIYSTLCI